MSRRSILIASVVVAGVLGWYWFRPERALIDRRVSEPAQAPEAVAVLRGTFHSNAHPTRGTATVYRLADDQLVVRLTDFETSDGPDVRIYLVAAADVNSRDDLDAGFINLGAMKGNIGDQSYAVPPGTDLARYRAVSVWCRRFAVNFGAAPLGAVN